MRIGQHQKVTMEEARKRALLYLHGKSSRDLASASGVGNAIWPNSGLRAQGLGFAASKILRALQDEGLVEWCIWGVGKRKDWGYLITPLGRGYAKGRWGA